MKRWMALAAMTTLGLAQDFRPARYLTGGAPPLPLLAVGGGQVLLELAIDSVGRPIAVTPLRTTPPFTRAVIDTVLTWRFQPAETSVLDDRNRRVRSNVLVAAVYRPPALIGPTLGEAPKDVASPGDDIAFPTVVAMPQFPVSARDAGIVTVEVRVDDTGAVGGTAVIHSAGVFDEVARAAVRQWKFRAARIRGASASTFVYVVVGFPAPIVSTVKGYVDDARPPTARSLAPPLVPTLPQPTAVVLSPNQGR
jgi:TonB family protein